MVKRSLSSPSVLLVATRPRGHLGELVIAGRCYKCAVGRAGLRLRKREGDASTPRGRFLLRRVLYRADRRRPPATALPVSAIAPDDGWCDAPGDRNYNRPVKLPYPASAEHLWRDDRRYDVIVVLDHNDAPPVAGRGSAVFFHIAAPDYAPTDGCVAVSPRDMDKILRHCAPGTHLVIPV